MFSIKSDVLHERTFFLFFITLDLSDETITPSGFKIFISVEGYEEKTAENFRNSYVAEKRIVSKL